ncbi:MAG TPA: RsmE family RNA methyltransferase [Treponemataceae bacterium]|nr:RsmE family RNA methyltransferase [Treponemataceae bacterium]
MRQFLLDQPLEPGERVTLEGSDFRYLVQVLRLAPGDTVEARLPDGTLASLAVERLDARAKTVALRRPACPRAEASPSAPESGVSANRAAASIRAGESMPPLPEIPEGFPRIILFQWILKGPKMDQVIRQATETGVSAIVPVSGERCLPREGDSSGRAARWARIVREARQQSGSPVATVVASPVSVGAIGGIWADVSSGRRASALVLTEAPLARKTLHEYLDIGMEIVALATGPEGGMTADELGGLERAGFSAVHFRTNVLRAETAALYGIAAAQSAIMESEKWQLKE